MGEPTFGIYIPIAQTDPGHSHALLHERDVEAVPVIGVLSLVEAVPL